MKMQESNLNDTFQKEGEVKMKGDFKIYLEQSFKMMGILILIYSIQLQQEQNLWFLPLMIIAFIFYVIFASEKIVERMLIQDAQLRRNVK